MSATADPRAGDDADLAKFGYKQELDRTLGSFATFAAGISYISILTGTFQLFYFGFAFGGPAYWWSWPLVFAGQLMVALCFAELASRYPIAGSIYNWSKRLSTPHVAWLAGWMMLTASIVTIAAVALAYQITLPQIDAFFQFYGDGTGKYDYAANAVILGTALIVFTTIINAIGVKLMARINSAGVFIELIAAVLLILAFAVNVTRGPGVVTETQGLGADWELGYLGAFLTASLASAYVMYGFDTASSLGEESLDPRRNAPKAILRALIASFLIGGAILLFAMMAVTDINSEELGVGGLQFIVLDVLGGHGRRHLPVVGGDCDHRLLPGGPHGRDPDDVRDGARQQPARRRAPRARPPEDAHADHPVNPDRRAGDRDPPGQHPAAADLPGDHERRDHHDLHRLPAGHGPDAAGATARAVALRGRRAGLLHARPLGAAGERRRRRLGPVHDDQPDLAAPVDL